MNEKNNQPHIYENKIEKLSVPFQKAMPVIKKVLEAGYDAYFVGGCVRDVLLGKNIHDVDIATSAYPEEMKQLFPKTIDVGIEHGTVMVVHRSETYEITTFRTESTYQDYRRPDSVTFVRSLEEDLKRRDFTINALAMNANGTILDYFNGMQDLQEKVVKAVGEAKERFHEDALRMMRAVRFVSQLRFNLESDTKQAIKLHNHLLEKIAVERIQIEFEKMLLGEGRPLALKLFIETKLYSFCPLLKGKQEGLEYLASLSGTFSSSTEAWVLLIWSLKMPLGEVEHFLRKWKCSRRDIMKVTSVYQGLIIRSERSFSEWEIYTIGLENCLLAEESAEKIGIETCKDETRKRHSGLPIHSPDQLAVSGHDLLKHFNNRPGKWVGEMILKAEQGVISKSVKNEKQSILHFLEYF